MSLRTTAAARQNEMNASMAVVATKTRGKRDICLLTIVELLAICREGIDLNLRLRRKQRSRDLCQNESTRNT